MTKLSVSFAATAMALLAATGCERKELEREAEDIEEAKQEVVEEKREVTEAKLDEKEEVRDEREDLREEKAEFALEANEQLTDLEKKFKMLDEQAKTVTKALDVTTGVGAEIQQAYMLAKAKLEAARTATTPAEKTAAINDARAAIDELEEDLDDYQDAV